MNSKHHLADKRNKYSIRKYTVGTASLLIGATFIFGAHTAEASAAEKTQEEAAQSITPGSTSEALASKNDQTGVNTNSQGASADNSETQATKEPNLHNTTSEKVEAETATSVAQNQTKNESAHLDTEVSQPKPVVEQAPTAEEKATTSLDKTTTAKEVAQSAQATNSVKTPTATAAPTVSAVEAKQAPSNNVTTPEDKASQSAMPTVTANDANVDKAQSMPNKLTDFANQQNEKPVLATPVATRKLTSKQEAATAFRAANLNTLVVDNNSGIRNIKTEIRDIDKDNGNNDGVIYPHNHGHLEIHVSFDVDNSVKAGDTFKIQYSNNLQISDFFENRVSPPNIYNAGGELIACGQYDLKTRTMTYTFTDFVDKHNGVSANLNLLGYIEREVVKQSGQQTVDVTVAGQKTSQKFNVQYQGIFEKENVNLNSFYDEYDTVTGEYSQIAYVNPKAQTIKNLEIQIYGYGYKKPADSSSAVVSPTDTVKVYEVPDNVILADSFKPDFSQLKELTVDQDYTLAYNTNGIHSATIKFNNKNNNNTTSKRYVVFTKGQQDMTSNQPLVQRFYVLGSDLSNKYIYSVYSENYIETQNSSARGQGDKTYQLGNRVWEDVNHNSVQDINDRGIANVTVTLKNPQTNEVIKTTVTDKDGYYLFDNLKNGDYIVEFTDPATNESGKQYIPVKTHVGNSEIDSDERRVAVTINNANDLTIDRGFEVAPDPTYTIGDKVWHDTNKDGIQNSNEAGIAGVKVVLTKADGTTVETTTDADGMYQFTNLPNGTYKVTFETPEGYEATKVNVGDKALDSDGREVTVVVNNADDLTIDSGFYKPTVEPPKEEATYTIGDKVWHDTNKDGIQNSNEAGIAGVKVVLTKADGTTVETTTDENGMYQFTNLPNGTYKVTFETPEGYEATKVNVGDKALDSDGREVTVIVNNADDLTIDSGFYKPTVEPPKEEATYTIGDKVWHDTNKDGIQNSNEAGIAGVKVVLTKADGTTVETTTDANGIYQFTNLPNGTYKVTFETPNGYEATKVNVGDKALDSDGREVTVVVNNADDLTIDSGFYKPTVEPPAPEVPSEPGEPEQPTPNKPNTPQPPAPEVPSEPGEPEQPTPNRPNTPQPPAPEVPSQPGKPEQPTPQQPMKPVHVEKHQVKKVKAEMGQNVEAKNQPQMLPETGEGGATKTTLLGSLFALFGGILLFKRGRREKKQQ